MNVLTTIINEFLNYGAEAQAKKLGLVKKPGFGMYGPPGQNIATHKAINNGTYLQKMGSSGVGGDLDEAGEDSPAAKAAAARNLEAKPGFGLYGPPGEDKPATHKWRDNRMIPLGGPDDPARTEKDPGDEKDKGDSASHMDTDGTISMPDAGDYDAAQEPEAEPEPETEPEKPQPVGGQKGRRQALRNLRLKIAQAGLEIKTKKGVGIYVNPDSVNSDKLSSIHYTPAQARIIDALVQRAGSTLSWEELEGLLDAQQRKQKKALPSKAPAEFLARQKQWVDNMSPEARRYFVNDNNTIRSDLSWGKFKRLTKTVNKPEEYLNFFDDMFVAMKLADEGNAEAVGGFIKKWGLAFEPKNNMYTQKILRRAQSDGKVFETGAASFVAEYLQRTGAQIPVTSTLDPWSPQALVPSNPDELETGRKTENGVTTLQFGERKLHTMREDSALYGALSEEDQKKQRAKNLQIEVMNNYLYDDDDNLKGVVITPEEGRLELTLSLKNTVAETDLLTPQGKAKIIQLIEDLEDFKTRGLPDERIKDAFNEFESKLHNVWIEDSDPGKKNAANNALTPLAESFSALRETMLGKFVIIPTDTNFPGTDIISIDYRDPDVASLIHTEVYPDITFGQVKRGSGAASSTQHKVNLTVFNDFGDVSGDVIRQSMSDNIDQVHEMLWQRDDLEGATQAFSEHFNNSWPIIAQRYGIAPDQQQAYLRAISMGKIPKVDKSGRVKVTKGANLPMKQRKGPCKKLRKHWGIQNSSGVLNMMLFNAQKSTQAIKLHSHVIGKGIVETDGKDSLYKLTPHIDKGLKDNCAPGTKMASYSRVDTSMNENIMESIVHEFLVREKENNDGVFNHKTVKDLALHHGVSVKDMSLELLKATQVEKAKGNPIKTAMKFAFTNLSEDLKYYG